MIAVNWRELVANASVHLPALDMVDECRLVRYMALALLNPVQLTDKLPSCLQSKFLSRFYH